MTHDAKAWDKVLDSGPDRPLAVYADWLEERGDPLAEAYRVMGEFGLFPERFSDGGHAYWARPAVLTPSCCIIGKTWWEKSREVLVSGRRFLMWRYPVRLRRKTADRIIAQAWMLLTPDEKQAEFEYQKGKSRK
jgi:hypothetical protein